MFDLSYFNLGFRSDNANKSLSELKEQNKKNRALLEDAFLIIDDCLKIKDEHLLISNISSSKGYEMNTLLPLLAEMFLDKKPDQIVTELEEIYNTIKKAIDDVKPISDKEFNSAISFFSSLADLCLSNSVQRSIKDSPSCL